MAQVGRKHDTGHADSRNSEAQEGAIGDTPEVTGLRLNYRDFNLLRVDGVSVTIWNPYDDARPSVVSGVAVGLPATGDGIVNFAEEMHGVQLGLINIAMNNPSGTRVLPVINFHRD